MNFVVVCIGMIVVLGIVAAVANLFDKEDDTIKQGHDCSTCTEAEEGNCKIHCLLEEKKKKSKTLPLLIIFHFIILTSLISCSTKKNTAGSRWWHSFNTRYRRKSGEGKRQQGQLYRDTPPLHGGQQAESRHRQRPV